MDEDHFDIIKNQTDGIIYKPFKIDFIKDRIELIFSEEDD